MAKINCGLEMELGITGAVRKTGETTAVSAEV
jgi:hypothetical protein